jgi:ABC-2 type transport system permease protein
MKRLLAVWAKDLLVLRRDRVGLGVLFVMPLALMLLFTVIQDGAFRKASRYDLSLAVVDEDQSALSRRLIQALAQAPGLSLTAEPGLSRGQAARLLGQNQAQACQLLPKGLQDGAQAAAKAWANPPGKAPSALPEPAQLRIFFDPSVPALYRNVFRSQLSQMVTGAQAGLALAAWGPMLAHQVRDHLAAKAGGKLPKGLEAELAQVPAPDFSRAHLLSLAPEAGPAALSGGQDAPGEATALLPDMVQQNVPGYTLFAMFFIVIPVSNAVLRERREGTLLRLRSMGVHPLLILGGKLLCFSLVGLLQFGLMLAAGRWLFPVLGLTAFHAQAPLLPLLTLTLLSSLAACGFSLAVAATATSADQAGVAGSTLVVMLAALGGVLVPLQAMPAVMRSLSGLTPLNWAMAAYQDLFLRQASWPALAPHMLLLVAFCLACLAWAWFRLFPKR